MRKALAPDISTWPDDEAQLVGKPLQRVRGGVIPEAATLPAL